MHILIGFVWPFYSTNTCENIMLYIINLYNFCQLKEGRKEGERKGRREEENEGGEKKDFRASETICFHLSLNE
jgi:hypothetical protein